MPSASASSSPRQHPGQGHGQHQQRGADGGQGGVLALQKAGIHPGGRVIDPHHAHGGHGLPVQQHRQAAGGGIGGLGQAQHLTALRVGDHHAAAKRVVALCATGRGRVACGIRGGGGVRCASGMRVIAGPWAWAERWWWTARQAMAQHAKHGRAVHAVALGQSVHQAAHGFGLAGQRRQAARLGDALGHHLGKALQPLVVAGLDVVGKAAVQVPDHGPAHGRHRDQHGGNQHQ